MKYAPGCYGSVLDNRSYTCIAELTQGQRDWFGRHDATRRRLDHYDRIKMMSKTTVIDGSGVAMAGPDSPALAAAQAGSEGIALEHVRAPDARSKEQMSEEYLAYTDHCRRIEEPAIDYATWADRTYCGSFSSAAPVSDLGTTVRQREARAISARDISVQHIPRGDLLAASVGTVSRGDLLAASVGTVSRKDAGILPSGPMLITEEMVRKARRVANEELGRGLEPSEVRAMLEAALHG